MLQKYTSIAICYLLATSSGIFVFVASANNNSNDHAAELYNNNNVNNNSNGRGNDEGGNNERRSFLNLGRRHFDHRTLLTNNKQHQQDTSDRSLQLDEATQLSEAQTTKGEAEQIMLSSSLEAQSAISQTISDISTNHDLNPLEKEQMLKLLKVEATEAQNQVLEDESHINSQKKKRMKKLDEEITNVEVVKDELDVAIQEVEEEVIKETLKGTEQKFNNNLTPTSGDKKYQTKAPSTVGVAGGGGLYMKTEPTMSPSPSSSSSGSSHSPSPSHDTLTTSKSDKSRGGGKSGGKSGGKGKSGKRQYYEVPMDALNQGEFRLTITSPAFRSSDNSLNVYVDYGSDQTYLPLSCIDLDKVTILAEDVPSIWSRTPHDPATNSTTYNTNLVEANISVIDKTGGKHTVKHIFFVVMDPVFGTQCDQYSNYYSTEMIIGAMPGLGHLRSNQRDHIPNTPRMNVSYRIECKCANEILCLTTLSNLPLLDRSLH